MPSGHSLGRELLPDDGIGSEGGDDVKPTGSCRIFHRWKPWSVLHPPCMIQRVRTCARCGKMQIHDMAESHDWSTWELYQYTRPRELDEDVSSTVAEVTVTAQRRWCKNCRKLEDRVVRLGSMGPPLPPVDTSAKLEEPSAGAT